MRTARYFRTLARIGIAVVPSLQMVCSARAADLQPSPPRQAITAGEAWDGLYFGLHVDLGFADSRFRTTNLLPLPDGTLAPVDVGSTRVRARDSGITLGPLVGGLQAGFNHVFADRFLLGFEAEAIFPDDMRSDRFVATALQTYNVQDGIKMFGTARARLGVAGPDWLLYGTGGFAVARDRFFRTQVLGSSIGGQANSGDTDTFYQWRYGFAVGAGVEMRLTSDWSAKLEYLYLRFPSTNAYFAAGSQQYTSDLQAHFVRVGLNYRFGDKPEKSSEPPLIALENWSLHGQSTAIAQNSFAFPAIYSGQNSLDTHAQLRETLSATAYVGLRLPTGTEIYANPEPFQGYGLSNTHGLAAFPNNEAQKAGFNYPHFNLSRLFARHVFGFGGEQETVEDGANQVAAQYDISRLTITAGKVSVPDFFDGNTYTHDARTSFMNWILVDAGAFDYAADQKGYTWGTVAELNQKLWAARAGYFLVPDVPNSNRLDTRLVRRGQYVGELEARYSILDQPGKLKLTGFFTRAVSGNFDEALSNPVAGGDVTATRRNRLGAGYIVNLEQSITDDLGVFSRVSFRHGTTEIIAWTDVDKSFSAGSVLKGTAWGRPADRFGTAIVTSGLSGAYRRYLEAGGLGLNIGDGALDYRRETALETFYALALDKGLTLTGDYQHFRNPGYNADRGPDVNVASIRLHGEF